MIKTLIEAFHLIRDDPYLNSVLNNPRYYRDPSSSFDDYLRIRVRSGFPAKVFPEWLDVTLTPSAEKLEVSLLHDSYACEVTEKIFNRLIDPELFVECVNILFEYKDFFQLEEVWGGGLMLSSHREQYPHVIYNGKVSRQSVSAQLFCDNAFSLWCTKRPGREPDFGVTKHGAAELSAGSSIVTTCDESDFINKLKAFLKPLEIEPFAAKHEHDAKEALDKLLSVIDEHLKGQ